MDPNQNPQLLTPVFPNSSPVAPAETPDSSTLENQNIEEQKDPKYRETIRFNLFVKYYNEKGHTILIKGEEKSTQYNATRSAMKAYDLDPEKQYAYAMSWGSECLRKSKFLAREWMEERGFNFNYMMAFALKMMQQSGQQGWWDKLMAMAKYAELEEDQQGKKDKVHTTNVYNLGDKQVEDFNTKFLKFIEAQ